MICIRRVTTLKSRLTSVSLSLSLSLSLPLFIFDSATYFPFSFFLFKLKLKSRGRSSKIFTIDVAKIVPHSPCMPRDRWHTSFENEISLPDEPSLPLFIVKGHLVSLWISWRSSSPETDRSTSSSRSHGFLFHGKKNVKKACFRSTWIFKQRDTSRELRGVEKRRKFGRECDAYFGTI